MITPDTFTTRRLEPPDQHEAWRQWFGPMFDITLRTPIGEGFAAENTVWRLGDLVVSRVAAPAVRVTRASRHLRLDPVDHWVLSYCQHGEIVIRTADRTLHVGAGVPYLWSLGEPHECDRTATNRIQFFLSRDAFRDIAPLLDVARGSVLDTPLGRLLGDFMLALERQLPHLEVGDAPRLTAAVRALVAACLAPSAERAANASNQFDFSRLERVRRAVRKHLHSPELGPPMLCRAVGMSRSNLYRLLEEEGGVSRFIQRHRLLEARATLCDPTNTRSIADIADDLCFADSSTFGRAFRKLFGYSPREARSAAAAGLTPPVRLPEGTPSNTTHFRNLLRGF